MDRNTTKPETCVLCFNGYPECNFEAIQEDTKDILSKLSIQIDAENRSMMCEYCSIKVKVFHAFKSACIRTENFITTFVGEVTGDQVDLKELFIKEKKEKGQGDLADTLCDRDLCRLCRSVVDKGCLYLNGTDCHVNAVKIFIQRCVPEVNVNNTKDPVVCDNCIELLKSYCAFLDSCADAKIQRMVKREFEANETEEFNEQATAIMENLGELLKQHSIFSFTSKEENSSQNRTEDMVNKKFDHPQFGYHPDDSNGTQQFNCGSYNYQNQVLVDVDTASTPDALHLNSFLQPSTSASIKIPVDPHSYDFHSDAQVKSQKSDLRRPKSQTKPKTRRKTPEDRSQIKPHRCYLCSFNSKHKQSLRRHMLVHKDPSEINWFKCELCSFKTKRKNYLTSHMLVHKDPSGIEWFKCSACNFKAKRKRNLKTHVMLVHKSPSETRWYKCQLCDFKAKYNKSLKQHQSAH
ncbi:hypothetical protein NQ315_007394 [Exocentrus adspersus]|uniref:C2H2-type domain-containing protein n=1 Tax=Exocentrus adspersus TaxID=1586481 RepID=A0AAV8VHX2_9CUCU|nr:hypothetical protein NQ315_007394 [Exocentrus adspersus]